MMFVYFVDSNSYVEQIYFATSSKKNFDEYREKTYYVDNDALIIENDRKKQKNQSKKDFVTKINHVDLKMIISSSKFFVCRNCIEIFEFNNKLHRHLKQCKIEKFVTKIRKTFANYIDVSKSKNIKFRLIESNTSFAFDIDFVFRI